MVWKISLFETSRREKPVEEFINSLEVATRAKVARTIILLKTYGKNLGSPCIKKLEGKVYELRIRGREEIRILFAYLDNEGIVLLHAFKKKSQKTPRKEIKTAQIRFDKI